MTPLLAAAVTGHIHIVEFLIGNRNLVSRQERIDALELLGATFVDKKRDMLGCYKLWKRAMEERQVYKNPKLIDSGWGLQPAFVNKSYKLVNHKPSDN